ncbi:acetyl-CoA hydrolase/transferase family protein [Salinibacillus xinjiangensis]|nr:acetyl-CoA hydrolase/transferase family protein [Salinibacillus xinjiangensis]
MNTSDKIYHKKIGIEDLLHLLKQNMLVYLEQGAAEPRYIIQELINNADKIPSINVLVTPVPHINKMQFSYDENCDHWNIYSLFGTPETKHQIRSGRVKYVPVSTSEIPNILRKTLIPDIAIIQVSPPDSRGFCNLGVSVDTLPIVIKNAKMVVAQFNPRMARVCGQSEIHVSEIDYFIEEYSPIIEFSPPDPREKDDIIAEQVAKLIPDGATIQIGIGRIPNAILGKLKDKNDLGLHSGLISEKMIELLKSGVITGKYKKINQYKMVGTAMLGTEELYHFSHQNSAIELHPVTHTHNIWLARDLDHFISINSAMEVDLTGQVNAESLDGDQISAVGGQLDFTRMARLSKEGKAILALPSTSKGKSNIVPQLSASVPISIPRSEVDIVVTEYGSVQLRHESILERAKKLISIAHPDYRTQLEDWLHEYIVT